jgi:hypothetical protein
VVCALDRARSGDHVPVWSVLLTVVRNDGGVNNDAVCTRAGGVPLVGENGAKTGCDATPACMRTRVRADRYELQCALHDALHETATVTNCAARSSTTTATYQWSLA